LSDEVKGGPALHLIGGVGRESGQTLAVVGRGVAPPDLPAECPIRQEVVPNMLRPMNRRSHAVHQVGRPPAVDRMVPWRGNVPVMKSQASDASGAPRTAGPGNQAVGRDRHRKIGWGQ